MSDKDAVRPELGHVVLYVVGRSILESLAGISRCFFRNLPGSPTAGRTNA